MPSITGAKADLVELAERLHTVAEAKRCLPAGHILSFEERKALSEAAKPGAMIGSEGSAEPHRGGRGVLPVIGMKDEDAVHRAGEHRVDFRSRIRIWVNLIAERPHEMVNTAPMRGFRWTRGL